MIKKIDLYTKNGMYIPLWKQKTKMKEFWQF
jgi:hypothetical protein